MITSTGVDMVKVSFDIQREELSYYYRAFVRVTQCMMRTDLDDDTRNSLSLMLNLMDEMLPDPDQVMDLTPDAN
jgi:hypothetical protein